MQGQGDIVALVRENTLHQCIATTLFTVIHILLLSTVMIHIWQRTLLNLTNRPRCFSSSVETAVMPWQQSVLVIEHPMPIVHLLDGHSLGPLACQEKAHLKLTLLKVQASSSFEHFYLSATFPKNEFVQKVIGIHGRVRLGMVLWVGKIRLGTVE